jgi:hypothetical protein
MASKLGYVEGGIMDTAIHLEMGNYNCFACHKF